MPASAASSRVAAVDVLRGFTLLAMALVNESVFHSGNAGALLIGDLGLRNGAIEVVILWLLTGKLILVFSFLFGWGIHTQATLGGALFRNRYLRRLLGFILIGLVHAIFFFAGDVLVSYGLIGIFMLWLRHLPPRKLVWSAAALFAIQALVVLMLAGYTMASPGASPGEDAMATEDARQIAKIYQTGSFWSVAAQRQEEFGEGLFEYVGILGADVLAMFCLGLATAKTFVWGGFEPFLPIARRLLWPALVIGVVGNGICRAAEAGLSEPWASISQLVHIALFAPALALGYLAAAALILARHGESRIAGLIGIAGRVSLTVYVGQSVLMSLLMHGYGLGLATRIGSAGSVLVALAVYAAMVAFAALWLKVLRIGPLEWILRSITEWRWVALRRERAASAGAAA